MAEAQPAAAPASRGSTPVGALVHAGAEARLADLDALPRGLWLWSLVHSQGRLEPRLAGVRRLREALAAGETAELADWPDSPFAQLCRDAIGALELPAFCADKPELADQVVSSLLWHLDRVVDYLDYGNDEAAARRKALADFADDWRERCGVVRELTAVLGDLGDLDKHTRWDLLRGVLRGEAWQEVVRIRALIERLPDLVAAIRRLGRTRPAETEQTTLAPDATSAPLASAARAAQRTVRVPELPGETRGVTRAGRIARMLPAESLLLAHPRLRLVWHARHAERALLCYDDDDRLREELPEPTPVPQPGPSPERRPEAGPMLVCVDTSGSMGGAAEAVAKAVVLEAARTAFAEGRRCRVYAFGGSDELVEYVLSRDAEGIARLAEFLGQRFAGGTDICTPLERALAVLDSQGWRQADLLIASDGEFGATPEMARAVDGAKTRLGLRIQGVLIGDRETIGFLEVADEILWIRDWRRFGGNHPAADSPVHSQQLTATYFPGALRGRSAPVASPSPDPAQAFRQPLRKDRPA